MSKRNPYKVAEKVLGVVGNALFWVVILAVIMLVVVVAVSSAWPYWGPWALASPLLIPVVYVLGGAAGVALTRLYAWVAGKWKNARREWDRKKEEAK